MALDILQAQPPLPSFPDAPPIEIEQIDHPGGDILIRGITAGYRG